MRFSAWLAISYRSDSNRNNNKSIQNIFMYACVYVCMYACLHTCRVLVLILSAPIVAAKMPSAVKRTIRKKRRKSSASYRERVRRHKMIDLFWRRVRAEARCIPVDFDVMEVVTRGNGLTRTELRLVDSHEGFADHVCEASDYA